MSLTASGASAAWCYAKHPLRRTLQARHWQRFAGNVPIVASVRLFTGAKSSGAKAFICDWARNWAGVYVPDCTLPTIECALA